MKNIETEVQNFVDIATAVKTVKENSKNKQRKFTETVDLIFNLNIDPKQSNQNIRGAVALPAGTGKDVRIVVFTDVEALQKDAIKAGAIKAGLDDLMTEIEGGFMDFDYCIATPDAMKKLSRVARKLGPRGLMPNPKNGNITDKVIEAINVAKKGKINFKNDKYGIVHTMVGKVNFDDEDLIANIKTVISAVKEAKPEVVKNKYIKSVFLTTTMGPSVAVDIERTNGGE